MARHYSQQTSYTVDATLFYTITPVFFDDFFITIFVLLVHEGILYSLLT